MGELADARLNGDDCEACGMPFDDAGDGFPRYCAGCAPDDAPRKPARVKTVACPGCTRKFHTEFALGVHRAAKEH